jgi:hypothetical protein
MLVRLASLIFLLSLAPFAKVAAAGKVEIIGAFTDATASESVRDALEAQGYRITLADGSVLCDLWFRKAVPTRSAKSDVPGAIYNVLADSTLVGVVSIQKATTDFRGQAVKSGVYTLRYGLHPTDGNHMGISPYRDFLLLIPVAADQNVDSQFKFEELVKMSARAAGTNHPTPFSLVSAEGQSKFPAVFENDHGHEVLAAKLKTQAGADMPIAVIVKGVAEQ